MTNLANLFERDILLDFYAKVAFLPVVIYLDGRGCVCTICNGFDIFWAAHLALYIRKKLRKASDLFTNVLFFPLPIRFVWQPLSTSSVYLTTTNYS